MKKILFIMFLLLSNVYANVFFQDNTDITTKIIEEYIIKSDSNKQNPNAKDLKEQYSRLKKASKFATVNSSFKSIINDLKQEHAFITITQTDGITVNICPDQIFPEKTQSFTISNDSFLTENNENSYEKRESLKKSILLHLKNIYESKELSNKNKNIIFAGIHKSLFQLLKYITTKNNHKQSLYAARSSLIIGREVSKFKAKYIENLFESLFIDYTEKNEEITKTLRQITNKTSIGNLNQTFNDFNKKVPHSKTTQITEEDAAEVARMNLQQIQESIDDALIWPEAIISDHLWKPLDEFQPDLNSYFKENYKKYFNQKENPTLITQKKEELVSSITDLILKYDFLMVGDEIIDDHLLSEHDQQVKKEYLEKNRELRILEEKINNFSITQKKEELVSSITDLMLKYDFLMVGDEIIDDHLLSEHDQQVKKEYLEKNRELRILEEKINNVNNLIDLTTSYLHHAHQVSSIFFILSPQFDLITRSQYFDFRIADNKNNYIQILEGLKNVQDNLDNSIPNIILDVYRKFIEQ